MVEDWWDEALYTERGTEVRSQVSLQGSDDHFHVVILALDLLDTPVSFQ